MDGCKKYLTDRVLSGEYPVTYRLLSRALNLHVNIAKSALHEFHKQQNASRANSVYATYLVSGLKSSSDNEMKSASVDDTNSKKNSLKIITLVAEENLQSVLDEYQQIDRVHVYSLASRPQRDLTLLSDVAQSIPENTKKEDPETPKNHGTILNSNVRRKERKGGMPIPPPSAPKLVKQEAKQLKQEPKSIGEEPVATAAKTDRATAVKREAAKTPPDELTPSSSAGKKPAVILKRGNSGSIMQSFAKAAAKPPKPKSAVKKEEDATAMALSDDGEADELDLLPSTKKPSIDLDALAKTRKEREEGLRRMMEEYDKEEEKDDEVEDEEMEGVSEPEPEPKAEARIEAEMDEKPSEVVSSSSNGRRRGRRRVTKKKRILDDQGYMVTIQEEGWESFSEDEAPPPASKQTPASTPTSSGSKVKKPAVKGSQGNIMSFFAKK